MTDLLSKLETRPEFKDLKDFLSKSTFKNSGGNGDIFISEDKQWVTKLEKIEDSREKLEKKLN